jgi:dihydroorotase
VLRHVNRRAAFHSEDEYRLADRRPLARTGDWTSHEEVRDAASALESTHRLVRIAKALGKRIHVLHVTTREEIEFLAGHKDVASVEVTPQHLTLTAPEAYERLKGYAQMNPPIRNAYHQAGLWHGIAAGIADVLGSDHAPHTKEEKARPYPASPSGMPGVQTLVPVMLTHVNEGRLSLERFVDLTSHGANRLFGMADKGRLAVGYDADITVVDMNARRGDPARGHGHPRRLDALRRLRGQGLADGDDHPRHGGDARWRTGGPEHRRAGAVLRDAGRVGLGRPAARAPSVSPLASHLPQRGRILVRG